MTRAEFIKVSRELLDELEADHEEHTGIAADEQLPFLSWQDEIAACWANTR